MNPRLTWKKNWILDHLPGMAQVAQGACVRCNNHQECMTPFDWFTSPLKSSVGIVNAFSTKFNIEQALYGKIFEFNIKYILTI